MNKRYLFLFLAAGISFQACHMFSGKKKKEAFLPGRASNAIRQRFEIPLIESDMIAKDTNQAHYSHWHTTDQFPDGNEVLHAWKTLTVGNGEETITSEDDAFRKRINDTLFYQLNISSVLKADSTVDQSGYIFLVTENNSDSTGTGKEYKALDKAGVDSVVKTWLQR